MSSPAPAAPHPHTMGEAARSNRVCNVFHRRPGARDARPQQSASQRPPAPFPTDSPGKSVVLRSCQFAERRAE